MKTIEAPLIESFILLNRFFQEHNLLYCLIGGLAAGYWGEPRYTQDMDFTLIQKSGTLKIFSALLRKNGFHFESKGAGQLRIGKYKNLRFEADIILSETEYQDRVVQRARSVKIFDVPVPICSAEDLIILKLIAYRRRDLLDIETILQYQKNRLEKDYLLKWLHFWNLEERFEKEGFHLYNTGA